MMTTESAGAEPVKLKLNVQRKFDDPKSNERLASFTDKQILFLQNPEKWLNGELFEKSLTDEMPGKIGSRSVHGRKERILFAVPLYNM